MTVENFEERVQRHSHLFTKRHYRTISAENMPPTGQAGYWYQDVVRYVPRSGRDVAKQIARLCGDDSLVTIPYRSLADAVGVKDKAGRTVAYTQRGIQALVDSGWLRVETTGSKRGARTTFYLLPGPRIELLPSLDEAA